MTLHTLCIFGTRPEAIKMSPIIEQFKRDKTFNNKVCVTGQHQEMLHSVLNLFDITPDFNLNVMTSDQNLSQLTAKILTGLTSILANYRPQLILVHGDTTTTLAASLSAYYHHIPIAHVEAGLRTGNLNQPWPEEANRKLTAALASIHFAPTPAARFNLLQEGVASESIFVTGNTVIDALLSMSHRLDEDTTLRQGIQDYFHFLHDDRPLILVTGHRRENFGQGFSQICQALKEIATRYPNLDIIYPVHLNPNVQIKVKNTLQGIRNIYLIPPVGYAHFIYLMKKSSLILTDSGGVQEETSALGKPLLVMRETTERPEALENEFAKLVGTNVQKIVEEVSRLLTNRVIHNHESPVTLKKNPYGDGFAAVNIVNLIGQLLTGYKEISQQTISNSRSLV